MQGAPANGTYDLRFTLYDDATAGSPVGAPQFKDDVDIADGLFTVEIDFGTNPFNGQRRWIEIAVRPGNSIGAYAELNPRIELTPVPYALFAHKVADSAIGANQLANDANALSKVSGGALAITPQGYLKQNKVIHVEANTPRHLPNSGGGADSNPGLWFLGGAAAQGYYFTYANVVRQDGGNNYDPQTGVFTVPVTGYYYICASLNVYAATNQSAFYFSVQRNNFVLQEAHVHHWNHFVASPLTISRVAFLQQGDTLRFAITDFLGSPRVYSAGSALSIYLLNAAQ